MWNRVAALAALMTAASPALAADALVVTHGASRLDNQVSLNAINLLFNEVSVSYERRVRPNLSVMVTPKLALEGMRGVSKTSQLLKTYYDAGPAIAQYGRVNNSLGLELAARYYANDDAMTGLFLQPSVGYRYEFATAAPLPAHQFRLSGKVGHQWFVAERVALSAAAGLSYNVQKQVSTTSRGISPDLLVAIGVPF